MTSAEISEIFAVITLAWPNSEIAKADARTLRMTVALWTKMAADVEYYFGVKAIHELCKKSKFPPTIAEFLEEVKAQETRDDFEKLHQFRFYHDVGADVYKQLYPDDKKTPLIEQSKDYYEYKELCKAQRMKQRQIRAGKGGISLNEGT